MQPHAIAPLALLNFAAHPAEGVGAGRLAAFRQSGPGGDAMATRPLAFGVRFRAKDRTLRVHGSYGAERGFVVEDARTGRPLCRRKHPSLAGALRDFAAAWRARLH